MSIIALRFYLRTNTRVVVADKIQKKLLSSSTESDPIILERMKNDSKMCLQYMNLKSKCLVLHERKYLVKQIDHEKWELSFKDISIIGTKNILHSVLLSASNNSAIFGVSIDQISHLINHNEKLIEPRPALFSLCEEHLNLATMGLNLLQWQVDNKYCSKCCSELKYHTSGRSCKCNRCDLNYYPRYNPVVIMLVTCGDYCLLGRNKSFPSRMFSALAGFIDVGESVEQAVVREVSEEVSLSLDLSNVKYAKSDFWGGFRRNYSPELMIGCIASLSEKKDPLCSDELADAKWFNKKDINNALKKYNKHSLNNIIDDSCLEVPPPFTTAHKLMALWCKS